MDNTINKLKSKELLELYLKVEEFIKYLDKEQNSIKK